MTGALTVYSATFMRYSLAVSPKNYLLFGCHLINFSAQATQGYRYLNYWKYVFYLYSLPCVAVRERKLIWEIIAGGVGKLSSQRALRRARRLLKLVHRYEASNDKI